jgi:hypothetical protein
LAELVEKKKYAYSRRKALQEYLSLANFRAELEHVRIGLKGVFEGYHPAHNFFQTWKNSSRKNAHVHNAI